MIILDSAASVYVVCEIDTASSVTLSLASYFANVAVSSMIISTANYYLLSLGVDISIASAVVLTLRWLVQHQ